jgi:hypothetical protein
MFEEYIVKINSYLDENLIKNGTGILIKDNLVITAEHVLCGNKHKVSWEDTTIEAKVINKEGPVNLLELEKKINLNIADIFCSDEILNDESKWTIRGFISDSQIKHSATGVGIIKGVSEDGVWDYYLSDIKSGQSQNYSGMSGTPVFSNNRIVGILQMQSINSGGILGLQMSSVNMFRSLLTRNNVRKSDCYIKLKTGLRNYTEVQIQKNINSKKYIPDIFVEESDYKECLRYFADPELFLKKAIRLAKGFDFKEFNEIFKSMGFEEINFNQFNENFDSKDFSKIYIKFYNNVCLMEKNIKSLNKKPRNNLTLNEYYRSKHKWRNNSAEFFFANIKKKLEYIKLRFLLLTKNAGQGKTNFVCDYTNNFLLEKDYFVLYYNAYDFDADPWDIIVNKLKQITKKPTKYILEVLRNSWKKQQRPMVIIIDGLNENNTLDNFSLKIKQLLEKSKDYPFLKIIMTTRNELLQERFSELENGTYLDIYKHLNMSYRSDDFKDRIFDGYLKYFNITIRKYTLMDRTYRKLTDDILLLRFFCEVNKGKKQLYLYDVYQYSVFQQYIDKKADEYQSRQDILNHKDIVFSLLDKISKYMLENKKFFSIPTSIFSSDEQELLLKMLHNEVIFKDEIIIKNGLLKDKSIVISFTFDEFRDFCLTKYILKNYDEEIFIEFWESLQTELSTIREGVTKYIFYLARTISKDDLLPIIEKLPKYNEIYWDYIWGLEDKWMTIGDKKLWYENLINLSEYDKNIVSDLLMKYDFSFFKNINISLLFKALDTIVNDLKKYKIFIEKMFKTHNDSIYRYHYDKEKAVFPYNDLLENLIYNVDDPNWNKNHKQIFKLTLYLTDLDYYGTRELWRKLILSSPKIAINLLEDMNNYPVENINGNIKELLNDLLKINNLNIETREKLDDLYNTNSFSNDMNIDLALFMEMIHGEDENENF